MNCTDIVERFTEYLDGSVPGFEARAIARHLKGCPSCVRYHNVLVHGGDVLRALPEPEFEENFGHRLQHRLYHVDDEKLLAAHGSSGTPAMTVVGIALVLTAVAWSPTLFAGAPVVELPPIVVDRAPVRAPSTPPGTFSSKGDTQLSEGLWANTLLYDYSPLSQRYGQRARGRRAIQPGR